MLARLVNLFPVWVLAAGAAALAYPPLFTWFRGSSITIGLGVIMLGMGFTLTLDDFKEVLKRPYWVFVGILLQYTVMPGAGWAMSYFYHLPTPFAVGLILVACCPGGTASNVVSYLAKADVPLSVTMTAISTLLAVIMTPLLTVWLAGSRIDVNGWGLFWSTIQVVILPITIGVLMNRFFPRLTEKIVKVSPLVAVIFITLIVASIVGQGRDEILRAGAALVLAVFSLHAFGFLLGYVLSKIMTRNEMTARTVSIEVGMQNSGLGVVLARQNFASPLVAIPSAISSVFHSLIASLLAAFWRKQPVLVPLPKVQGSR
jgi:BASS family bile acid:Na+ symporter